MNGISKRNKNVMLCDIKCNSKKEQNAKNIFAEFINEMPHCRNLIFNGHCGTGKTMAASAIINELHKLRITGAIRTVRQIIRKFDKARDFNSTESETALLSHLVSVDLLVIDEIGIGKANDQEKMILHDIIDGRYGDMKPTILISNLSGKNIGENIGERLISRLKQNIIQIHFHWESKR